jgi:hypothetical protein
VPGLRRWIDAVLQAEKAEGMDKLTYEEQEKALNFYALDFEEFLRENFQPGTMSMEHALNMLSWPAFEPVVVPCNSRTR